MKGVGIYLERRNIKRGDIYFANLNQGIGSEQQGTRPVVIIQNNLGNTHSPTVIVAAITGKRKLKNPLPTHCELSQIKNLKFNSMALAEQLLTLDKSRLQNYVGSLNDTDLNNLNHALSISLALP